MQTLANLYNPHAQTKQALIDGFVVRRATFQKLFNFIKKTDMRHPPQHLLIEGQRGMGKTTLLLRLGYEVENDEELNKWLIPVVLAEEAYYNVMDLAGLWEEVAARLRDKGIECEAVDVSDEDYERDYLAALTHALDLADKKVVLFIDNIGELFKNFDELQAHRFREVLLTCHHFLLVGATAVTLEASFEYEHAFYEFFKKETLAGLGKEETHELLLQLASVCQSMVVEVETDSGFWHRLLVKLSIHAKKTCILSNVEVMRTIIEHQPGRVETLRILTGGVIRTIVLLFEIFVDEQNGNALSDLETVLDRVTPLYKHRMDDLEPLQRKVVSVMALHWDAMAVEEITQRSRLTNEQVSSALEWLEKNFVVQRASTDTKSNFYYVKERFFNIWYLMRLAGRGSQEKVLWLVRFLEAWYDEKELVQRVKLHISVLTRGDYYPKAAFYMAEAMSAVGKLDMDTEYELKQATKTFLAEKDESLLAELSPSDRELFDEAVKYDGEKNYEKAVNLLLQIKNKNESVYFGLGYSYDELKQFEKAEKYYLMAVEKGDVYAMYNLGLLYKNELKDYQKAEKYYLMAIEEGYVDAMYNLGILYQNELKDYQKAEKYYLMAVEKGDAGVMNGLAWFYFEQKIKKTDALKYAQQAVEKEKDAVSLHTLACIYLWHNEVAKAIKIDKEFMYYEEVYKEGEEDITLYLMLLLAKHQYTHVNKYFTDPKLNLKDRFKPLYYALLKLTHNPHYAQCPPELHEPVNDIIQKIHQLAIDYA